MVSINILVGFVDLDLYFVKDTFGPNEEITRRRVDTPDDGRCAVDLSAQVVLQTQGVQKRKVARQDGVFGVFDVGVFHIRIIGTKKPAWEGGCDS